MNIGIQLCVLLVTLLPLQVLAQQNTSNSTPERPRVERNGQRYFDFNIGNWKTHIKVVLKPLTGSTESIELNGTVTVRKVWSGRAQLEEIEADGPNGDWQGLTLFLDNLAAHQWGQTFANSKLCAVTRLLIGEFKNAVAFFAADAFEGRSILVRAVRV